jgi:hypothetical protein
MNEQTITPANEVSFKDFLFKNKRNRTILILAAVAMVVQWAVFKYFYPFANFIHGDSFAYLKAAYENLSFSDYLIGYSKFLRLFSVLTSSDFLLVAFQYFFIQCSAMLFLTTLIYFYKPSNLAQAILLCFIIFNPLFLHLGNMISSDGIFLGLSFIWISHLFWIIHNPSKRIILWHGILLFIAFTVRYNAIIYPFISAGAFGLSKLSIRQKIAGICLGPIICLFFAEFTSYKFKELTGYWQYSPFSGWQMANNAMYAYRYVDSNERKPVIKKFYELDKMIREHFDSTKDFTKFPTEGALASTFYMWSPRLPLFKYRDRLFKDNTNEATELKRWASMGPFYKSYGIYMIKLYPWHYIRFFIWPNITKYYAPPIEFLEYYNAGQDSVGLVAAIWFKYKSRKISTRMKSLKINTLDFFPMLAGVINLVMLCNLTCYGLLKGWLINKEFNKGILLCSMVWILNAVFTIFASSAALRFQSFPIVFTFIFVILLVDWMVQLMAISKMEASRKKLKEDLASDAFA